MARLFFVFYLIFAAVSLSLYLYLCLSLFFFGSAQAPTVDGMFTPT